MHDLASGPPTSQGQLMAMATAMAPEEEKETDNGYEKTDTADGNMVHEEWNTRSRSGE